MLENEHWNQWEMIPFMDQQAAIAKSRLLFLPFLLFFHLCFDAFNPVAHLISGDWLVTRLYGKHTSEWEMVRRTFFQLMFPSKHSILTTLQQHLFVVWACLNWTTQMHRAVGVPSQEVPMPMDTLLEAASPHLWGAVGCVCVLPMQPSVILQLPGTGHWPRCSMGWWKGGRGSCCVLLGSQK